MKTVNSSVVKAGLLVLLAFGTVASAAQQTTTDYRKLEYPALREIKIPEVSRVTLSNGMQLLLLEDHELPLIQLTARIRTGSIYDPVDKIGLADMTGEVMRTGGTLTMSGDEIDELLESMAASIETGMGTDYGFASLSVLKQDISRTLSILADILMNPAFPQDKIDLAKIQMRSAIARRNDEPDQIAGREFSKLIYGEDSVYARHTEYATVNAITRDDLVAFHRKFYGPNAVIAAVWGDFQTDEMVKVIESAFKGWKKVSDSAATPPPKVDYRFVNTVNMVPRPDLNQSNVVMGHIGGIAKDPDYPALVVMNQILGGGFTGRLFKNVRSREGLAYSVFGSYGTNYAYPGMFTVGCQTKSESTLQAISAMTAELKKIRESEVTQEELKLAKESFMNSFVFNFDTEGEIVSRILTYEYYGYPADFLMKMRDQIEKVTAADILRAARTHIHPDKLQILVVGNPNEFDKPLSILGQVRTIDTTIPAPKQ